MPIFYIIFLLIFLFIINFYSFLSSVACVLDLVWAGVFMSSCGTVGVGKQYLARSPDTADMPWYLLLEVSLSTVCHSSLFRASKKVHPKVRNHGEGPY